MTAIPFAKDAKPELDKPGKRKPLTRVQIITLCIRQVGYFHLPGESGGEILIRCGCGCGAPLKPKCIDEHLDARDSLPADRADLLSNRALYNPECAKKKTVTDSGIVAKNRRVRGERGSQQARRAASGSSFKGAGRKLQNRGFDKSLKKKFNGEVTRR